MSIEYNVDNSTYILRYRELKDQHYQFCIMTDAEFLQNVPGAAHLACIIGWMKELSLDDLVGDHGIIHELIHIIDHNAELPYLPEIRAKFESLLKLA